MSKKNKRRSKPASKKTHSYSRPPEWGFDFGVSARAAAVGSLTFERNLRAAEIVGVSYGAQYSRDYQLMLPAISIIGRNEQPLREAFEEFGAWADASNGDAVDVGFLFKRTGGYRLAVGPNITDLADRAFGYDAVFNHISFMVTWIKPIDTTSPALMDLRKNLQGTLRPVLFSGAVYTGLGPSTVSTDSMKSIDRLREIIKFDMRFVDEGSEADIQWQRAVLLDERARKSPSEMPLPEPKSLAKTRSERLRTLFPVTLWRSHTLPAAVALREAARTTGLKEWQIDQALCNLIASTAICAGRYHFTCITKTKWPSRYTDWLRSSFERATGNAAQFQPIPVQAVIRQATLDAAVLLSMYHRPSVNQPFEQMQKSLHEVGLLSDPE